MSEERMFTFVRYLRDKWFALLLLFLTGIVTYFMCTLLGVNIDGALTISLFVLSMGVLALIWDYSRKKKFWQNLEKAISSIESASQLRSFIGEPHALESELAADIVEYLLNLANNELTQAEFAMKDYRDYIELWIHEAKTPIAAAKLTLSHMTSYEADTLSGDIERIENQVEQALYYARMTSVASDYFLHKIKLADPIREACKRQARLLIQCQTIPHIELNDETPVYSDAPWLTFMFGQILVNAAQYGAQNVWFKAHEQDVDTSSGHVTLEIVDDGCGIAESDMPRIFDRGFTGINGRSRGNATGMGLYLVAKMSEQLGIGIMVASEEGKGTRVIFSFPLNSNLTKV